MSRRERRKLVKSLRRVEQHIWDMEVMGHIGPPGTKTINPRGREARARLQTLLGQYDSRKITRLAERWGIDIPNRPEWYSTEIKEVDPDEFDGRDTVIDRWLNEEGRTMISRQISEARFASWKRWVDLLVPILALLVALVAVFKDVIIEVLKK